MSYFCHFRLSVLAAITRGQFLHAGRGRKPQICRSNCHPNCHNRDISISGFGGLIAISGCRSLSQSLGDTLFELAMVVNAGLAVGISTLSVVVPVVLPSWWPYRYFRLSFDVIVTCWPVLRARRGRKPQVCRRNCSDICHLCNKKAQLSLTNPSDACEKFARFT